MIDGLSRSIGRNALERLQKQQLTRIELELSSLVFESPSQECS